MTLGFETRRKGELLRGPYINDVVPEGAETRQNKRGCVDSQLQVWTGEGGSTIPNFFAVVIYGRFLSALAPDISAVPPPFVRLYDSSKPSFMTVCALLLPCLDAYGRIGLK